MNSIRQSIDISPVWSGHPVSFDLITKGQRQFVAFYDSERRMTVGQRDLKENTFKLVRLEGIWIEARERLSTEIGWDSHNYVTMAIDKNGYIHLCGNMHVDPLIYFRTTKPLDITTFERIDFMVGQNEMRCTYPVFLEGPNGELIFNFRDGSSGNGVDYYNCYDENSNSWSRLIDQPILDGMDKMNAYARTPKIGPDGYYHMIWMWRDTGGCSTNHDISYARSADLVNWEAGDGTPIKLPITIEDTSTIIDPCPPGGGLINMCQSLGFDSKKRPIVSYHKNDSNPYTQAYAARLENGEWKIYQISDWNYLWAFEGPGSIAAEIQLGGAQSRSEGNLAMSWWHIKEGSGMWKLDENTMKIVGDYPQSMLDIPEDYHRAAPNVAKEIFRSELDHHNTEIKTQWGRGDTNKKKYLLVWETLPHNRDQSKQSAPPPSTLKLHIF